MTFFGLMQVALSLGMFFLAAFMAIASGIYVERMKIIREAEAAKRELDANDIDPDNIQDPILRRLYVSNVKIFGVHLILCIVFQMLGVVLIPGVLFG